jgi:alpha,alpha-trehalase
MPPPSKPSSPLEYIERYWKRTLCRIPRDSGLRIGLPNPYISPNHLRFKGDMFYWDSYFQNLGLLESGRIEFAKGIVENFAYLFMRFGVIPARNRFYDLGQSHPPFLTSMILDVFDVTKDEEWLKTMTKIAEEELRKYWMARIFFAREGHLAYEGLSRYSTHLLTHMTAEHESAWDLTSRYKYNCLDYLPIDLNSLLFKYETDLKAIYGRLGNSVKVRKYSRMAAKRKKTMNNFMWTDKRGFFFDYNYNLRKRSSFYSLAGFFPLWTGMASEKQAKRMVRQLKRFEYRGGLAVTQKQGLSKKFRQWDYPNGWPNIQYIVVSGLLRYGYASQAKRIALKWTGMNERVFKRTGQFWEKYNVVTCSPGKAGRYVNQPGFGWSNAVYLKFLGMFGK